MREVAHSADDLLRMLLHERCALLERERALEHHVLQLERLPDLVTAEDHRYLDVAVASRDAFDLGVLEDQGCSSYVILEPSYKAAITESADPTAALRDRKDDGTFRRLRPPRLSSRRLSFAFLAIPVNQLHGTADRHHSLPLDPQNRTLRGLPELHAVELRDFGNRERKARIWLREVRLQVRRRRHAGSQLLVGDRTPDRLSAPNDDSQLQIDRTEVRAFPLVRDSRLPRPG